MTIHVKFLTLFTLMGVITFLSCYLNDKTTSFMLYGNIYALPLFAAGFVFGLSTILYGLSIWWGPYAYKFIENAAIEYKEKQK